MAEGFSSELGAPQDRFLSLALQYSLAEKWLSPGDLVAEFPPSAIMAALEGADALRSKILVEAAGVHEKIAPKKSTAAAAEDLKLALDEGVCTAADLLKLLTPDQLVRYFEPGKLWKFLTKDEFFKQSGGRERDRVLFLLQTALDEELTDLPKLVAEVGPEKLAAELPKKTLEKVLVEAITAGLSGSAFDAEALVLTVPLADWVAHVPLSHLWATAVFEVAVRAGLSAAEAQPKPKAPPKAKKSQPAAESAEEVVEDVDVEVMDGPSHSSPDLSVAPVSDRSREEIVARDRALLNLRNIDREPHNPESLSTPLLLAIDAMYAELMTLTDDESRAECIRDAFPNQKLLIEGLYALAESLDPRLDANALKEKEADINALIQLVLFEERRRDSGLPSRASSPPPLVQSSPGELPGRSVSPPPLPPPPPPPLKN